MGRLARGAVIVLFYLTMNVFAAFLVSSMDAEATPTTTFAGTSCTTSGNVTNCGESDRESFFDKVVGTSVSGFDGAPEFFNVMWVLVGIFLLALGVLEAVFGVLPLYSE